MICQFDPALALLQELFGRFPVRRCSTLLQV